jgi:hypothetical protein
MYVVYQVQHGRLNDGKKKKEGIKTYRSGCPSQCPMMEMFGSP